MEEDHHDTSDASDQGIGSDHDELREAMPAKAKEEAKESWRNLAADAQIMLPTIDPVSNNVVDPQTKQILGRCTLMHKDTAHEALSCYCRMHGCKKLVRSRQAPSFDQVRAWFAFGLNSVPAGKDHAAQHLAEWSRLRD